MRALIRALQPDQFEDIVAINALYRRADGGEHAPCTPTARTAASPSSRCTGDRPLLEDTYQIMVYQEQVMQVAQAMAGYTMAEADNLRKAMGKKIKSVMDAEKAKFVAGCVANGYSSRKAPSCST